MIVEIYRNLHKQLFSIRSNKTGRVVGHSVAVAVRDAKLVVQQGGRRRVIREKRKNVHAFVKGELAGQIFKDVMDHVSPDMVELMYNPYKYDSFVVCATKVPVQRADMVVLYNGGMYASGVA